jgi:hypothetical protein
MASRKPLTQSAGLLEQLQAVDTLTVGDYDLPNAISDNGKMLITVNSAAVWDYASHVDLTNITVDDHHDKSHLHNGADGSGDVYHGVLQGITTDAHHAKSHNHAGDGSGVVEHDSTANGTIVNHDTTATGANLTTLTDSSNADSLHEHDLLTLSGDVTYYVATTGNDATGTGNVASPWASIGRALEEVNKFNYEQAAVATVVLAEGAYSMRTVDARTTAPYTVIKGTALYSYTTDSISAVSAIGGGVYDVTLTVNTSVGMTTSSYLAVVSPSGKRYLSGGWEIRSVPDGTHVQIRLTSPIVAVTTGAFGGTAWLAPTVITTIDPTGVNVYWSSIQFTQLTLIKGGSGVDAFHVKGVGDVLIGPNILCNGYDNGAGLTLFGGYCDTDELVISNSLLGVWAREGSGIFFENSICSGCVAGLQTFGSAIWLDGCLLVGNSFSGASSYEGGAIDFYNTLLFGNSIGAWANRQSFVRCAVADGNSLVSNTTDLSPAADTEGNLNSYMKG